MSDASILLRDIAGDAATKAASKVKPSEEELAQIDQHAEDNTWHEAPDLSKESLRNKIQSRLPIGKKDVQDATATATQAADPAGSSDPAAVAAKAAQDQQTGGQTGVDAVGGVKAGAGNLKQKISDNTPEERKQQLREYRERTRNYFKGKMPKDRRDQLILRLKKMVVEIQGHQDCRFRWEGGGSTPLTPDTDVPRR